MRIVLAGGGTAGHIFPTLAVAGRLRDMLGEASASLTIVCGARELDRELYRGAPYDLMPLNVRGLVGAGWLRLPWRLWQMAAATGRVWRDFTRHPPNAIVASGGYLSVPVVLAGWARRIPIVLFAGDTALALGTRVMAPLVNVLTVSFAESRRHVWGPRVELAGYPLRPAFLSADPVAGRRQLDLAAHDRLLLIMGGSQGAHAINEAVRQGLHRLVDAAVVVHLAGRADLPAMTAARDRLPPDLRSRYRPFGFVQEGFASLLAAADVVVCRAGATTVAELGAVGAPAVIVPFRFGRAHQVKTARAVEAAGAAVVVEEHELLGGRLIDVGVTLLADAERLARMRAASAARGRPDAAGAVARIAIDLASAPLGGPR